MLKKEIVGFVLQIATDAHKSQKRWDGSPYINHPIEVAKIAVENHKKENNSTDQNIIILQILGLAHDLAEDTDIGETKFMNMLVSKKFITETDLNYYRILDALRTLNKNVYSSYTHYIVSVQNNWFAKRIKIADLTHNLSDLKHGSMRDKYELALYMLQHHKS